jgi:predicted secreted protein
MDNEAEIMKIETTLARVDERTEILVTMMKEANQQFKQHKENCNEHMGKHARKIDLLERDSQDNKTQHLKYESWMSKQEKGRNANRLTMREKVVLLAAVIAGFFSVLATLLGYAFHLL